MQPNDPNKTDPVDTDATFKANESEPTVITPGAPELPGTPIVDDQKADTKLAPESSEEPAVTSDSAVTGPSQDAAVTAPAVEAVAAQPEPVVAPAGVTSTSGGKKGKKKFGIIAIIVAILLLGGGAAGAYFGVYLPSKPENMWKSAMANSGKVYDEAIVFATKERSEKPMKIEGSYDLDGAVESDGKVTGEWKGLDGKVNGDLSAAGLKVGFDVRTIKATDDSSDLYFKLSGLQGLGTLIGGGQMGEVVNSINEQWFVVDHTLLEQAASVQGDESFTKEDVTTFMEKAGVPTKEYLLSSDPQKAVFEVRQQIGSEKKEGRNTYRYKVGYNNENFGKYVEALCNAVKDDKIGKLALEKEKKSCADLGKDAAKEKTDETADVWVDKRTKLPHVVRISDPKSADNWMELGQDYQGGDEFPMSFKLQSKEDKQNIEVDVKSVVNTKTDAVSVDGTFSAKAGQDQNVSGKMSLKLTPSSESSVKVDKPENAKSIIELMNSLGLGELIGNLRGGSNMTPPSSFDIEDLPQSVQ